uniref:Disease resistance R13L4/SHOC-2-like LRR domain-containing protein n=1 Tax=Lactuca sativa TaxID=4236 RepID=A0A9R1V5Y7_LACSA|nr:hypothetical protein LSAT_V11C600318870 [Lactuca sativa]
MFQVVRFNLKSGFQFDLEAVSTEGRVCYNDLGGCLSNYEVAKNYKSDVLALAGMRSNFPIKCFKTMDTMQDTKKGALKTGEFCNFNCSIAIGRYDFWYSKERSVAMHENMNIAIFEVDESFYSLHFVFSSPSSITVPRCLRRSSLGLPSAEQDNCCEWSGVTCNNQKGGHVTELDLMSCGLVGEISHSLVNLTYLNYLDLSGNSFHGTIPTFIGSLTHLRSLLLGGNNLNGTIPRSIGSLTELWYLDLSSNSFHGTIPPEFGNLTNLQWLLLSYAGRCRFENLEWLSNLSHLEELHMDGISLAKTNHWVGVILSLRKLSVLSLSGCELSQVTSSSSSFAGAAASSSSSSSSSSSAASAFAAASTSASTSSASAGATSSASASEAESEA